MVLLSLKFYGPMSLPNFHLPDNEENLLTLLIDEFTVVHFDIC